MKYSDLPLIGLTNEPRFSFWTFELIKIGNVLPKLILSTNLPSSRLRWAGNIPSTTSLTESRTRGGTMKLLPYSVVLLSVALALGAVRTEVRLQ